MKRLLMILTAPLLVACSGMEIPSIAAGVVATMDARTAISEKFCDGELVSVCAMNFYKEKRASLAELRQRYQAGDPEAAALILQRLQEHRALVEQVKAARAERGKTEAEIDAAIEAVNGE